MPLPPFTSCVQRYSPSHHCHAFPITPLPRIPHHTTATHSPSHHCHAFPITPLPRIPHHTTATHSPSHHCHAFPITPLPHIHHHTTATHSPSYHESFHSVYYSRPTFIPCCINYDPHTVSVFVHVVVHYRKHNHSNHLLHIYCGTPPHTHVVCAFVRSRRIQSQTPYIHHGTHAHTHTHDVARNYIALIAQYIPVSEAEAERRRTIVRGLGRIVTPAHSRTPSRSHAARFS
jgi:hypothetical protein